MLLLRLLEVSAWPKGASNARHQMPASGVTTSVSARGLDAKTIKIIEPAPTMGVGPRYPDSPCWFVAHSLKRRLVNTGGAAATARSPAALAVRGPPLTTWTAWRCPR